MSSAPPDRDSPAAEPWYASGLCFECLPDCGRCCTNHGDHEHLYLNEGDVARLALHFGLDPAEFAAQYTALQDGWVVLRMEPPSCRFLDGTRCTVYAARPTQCRTFPFWRENLATPRRWERLTGFCPGIGRGPAHGLARIRAHLATDES